MANRADELIDRRRLRRKLSFWRVVALLAIVAAVAVAGWWGYRTEYGGGAAAHIAKVKVEGTVTEDDELIERLEDIRKSVAVQGVILSVDSPGGTTAGGEAIFDAVRKLAAEKPVVAQVGTLAASAGYMIASASDHIVARQSSIVGSIGVLVQYPDVSALMDRWGIRLEAIKSSPLKAEPNPFTPTTEEERQMISRMILDSYDWFVALVDERRPLDRAEVERLADGSVFTGRQALANKLVDELGGEDQAVAWLGTKGVNTDLDVVEWKKRNRDGSWFLPGALTGAFGMDRAVSAVVRELGAERLFLDGLLSVWHPENAP